MPGTILSTRDTVVNKQSLTFKEFKNRLPANDVDVRPEGRKKQE